MIWFMILHKTSPVIYGLQQEAVLISLTTKKKYLHTSDQGHDICVNDVLIDHNNNIWLGSTEGLYLFNEKFNSFKNYAFKPGAANCLSDDHIYHLVEDNMGMIWIATQNGLNCLNPATQQFTVYKSDPADRFGLQTSWIRTVYKDQAGSIWVGTLGSGIARYNPCRQAFHYLKKKSP